MSVMTTRTLGSANVVISGVVPLAAIVAVGALTGVMVIRALLQVAGLAIGKTAVVKDIVLPISDDVTVGTLAFIMILWGVIW